MCLMLDFPFSTKLHRGLPDEKQSEVMQPARMIDLMVRVSNKEASGYLFYS